MGECGTENPANNCNTDSGNDIYLINCVVNGGTATESLMYEKQGGGGMGFNQLGGNKSPMAALNQHTKGVQQQAQAQQMMTVPTAGAGTGGATKIVMASGAMCVAGLAVLYSMGSTRRRSGYESLDPDFGSV